MARVRPRTPPRTPVEPVPGQLDFLGSDPWQPTRDCRCWPLNLRGCHHCKTCDACQDCGRCAGRGCTCACET